ncbi:MAG: PilZ domain-containing protein [Methyloligellaceae bacterium]
MSEERKWCRYRTLKSAKIIRKNENLSLDCTLRNRSEFGAQIALESPVAIPNEMELLVESDELSAACTVVWQDGNRVGLCAYSGWKPATKTNRLSKGQLEPERYVI